ncbi:MAG TPA: type II toxin-antitoxin system VapC family toxin [Dermatophilaceae bacterium]|jgi:predicted nucleic acid-binding protein|nr:type II toxin-antitoxin system VapC family toxin [Actinomycetales bacterium]HMT33629.1 type II toxin-antitoxin system VapC family toxin [Dermatophilaceae bacterium]HMT89676.1 type II toxin-antitoxin system VapC family toxin [Dermatophilaceae bacterium]
MASDPEPATDAVIVVDASVVVDLLTMPSERALRAAVARHRLHAPALIDYEVLSAIRGLERSGNLDEVRAEEALADYSDLPIVRASCDADQRHRIWSLRHNLTAYDAAYVALAARLDRPVWTRDAKVLAAAGRSARVVLV